MGSYHVDSGPEEIIGVIRKFATENKLGEIHISSEPAGELYVRTGKKAWLGVRCLWICVADSRGLTIDLRVLPSLLRMVGTYVALCVVAVGAMIVSGVFVRSGPRGIECAGLAYGLAMVVAGLLLFQLCRWRPAIQKALQVEKKFAQRLTVFRPRLIHPAQCPFIPTALQVGLLVLPCGILLAGLTRAYPILGVLVLPVPAAMALQTIPQHLSMGSPQVAWRLILSRWIATRMITCHFAFVGLSSFFLLGTGITVCAQGRQTRVDDFIEAVTRPFTYYASSEMDRSVLVTNVRFVQGMADRIDVQPEMLTSALQLFQAVLACLAFALMIWGMKGYVDWLKIWTLVRQRATPTLGPPSVPPDLGPSARRGFCATLAGAAIVNVLHLILAVDILSTLFADRYVISRVVGQSVGWALLDVEAAVEGIPQKSAMGVAVSLVLALPTLLVFLGWTVTSIARVLSCRRRTHCLPVEPRLREIVGHLASHMAVRPPTITVVDRDGLYLETILSWLPGKATLLVSRGTFEELDACELEAAIAHELAHIKYDLPAVLMTRWLSALSLFPCNVFALVLDTEKRELRADRAAASIVASSEAMRRAIAKTSLGSILVTTRSGVNQAHRTLTKDQLEHETFVQRLIRYAVLASAMAQPTFMLGYTHPPISDRLAALEMGSRQKPSV